jgi:hypothetical protein
MQPPSNWAMIVPVMSSYRLAWSAPGGADGLDMAETSATGAGSLSSGSQPVTGIPSVLSLPSDFTDWARRVRPRS